MFLPLLVNEKDILMPIKSAKPGAQIFDIHLEKNMTLEPYLGINSFQDSL
jgi:hypothetical protein